MSLWKTLRSLHQTHRRPTRKSRMRRPTQGLLCLEPLETRTLLSSVYWTGDGDGTNWSEAANWSDGEVPGQGDFAVIDDGDPTVVVGAGVNASVNSLFAYSANLEIESGGSLSVAADSMIEGPLSNAGSVAVQSGELLLAGSGVSSGTFTEAAGSTLDFAADADGSGGSTYDLQAGTQITGLGTTIIGQSPIPIFGSWGGAGDVDLETDVTLPNLTLNMYGYVEGTGDLTINGPLTWEYGWLDGTGTTYASDGITGYGGGLEYGALDNSGTATMTGPIFSGFGATWNNLAGSTFNVQGATGSGTGLESIDDLGTAATFNNDGTVLIAAGAEVTATFDGVFNNMGSVEVQSGTLDLNDGGVNNGSFIDGAGATLDFAEGTFDLQAGTQITGVGTTVIVGAFGGPIGEVNLGTDVTLPNLGLYDGASVEGTGDLTITGSFTWDGGTLGSTGIIYADGGVTVDYNGDNGDYLENGMLDNAGTATVTGSLVADDGATWNNLAGSTFEAQGDGTGIIYDNVGAEPTFNNDGSVVMAAGSGGIATFGGAFNNKGSVDVQSGSLTFTGDFTQTSGGTTLAGNTLTAADGVDIEGGTLSGPGQINGDLSNAGEIDPGGDTPGILAITGTYTQTAAGALDIQIGGTAGSDYDQLNIGGSASLDGALILYWINNFVPAGTDTFPILTFGSGSGEFATITGLDASPQLPFEAIYDPTDVTLVAQASQAATQTTVTSSAATSVYGQLVTFTATVSAEATGAGTPTGTVTFYAGTTALGTGDLDANGQATFATSDLAVGSYAITASYSGDDNFDPSDSTTPVQQTVTQSPLTITADDQTMTYGGTLPTLTASYSGFVNGDTAASLTAALALTTTATSASPAGSYDIAASGALDPNYTISYVDGTLSVIPAALTIVADDQTMTYGGPMPGLTASYRGFVNGDTVADLTTQPTVATAATAASPVGSYDIAASGAVDPNYAITYVDGTLSVTPAALTITADDQTMTYGGPLPSLTASYAGFVNGDTAASLTTQPTLWTSATSASPVGGYEITASGAADPNYNISYVDGTMTVNPASLTITANDQTMTYGGPLPTLTAGYSGFVNGDTAASLTTPPTLATTAIASSHVGSYAITASGAVDPNYLISYVAGTLSVTPASLTITANSASMTYGGPLPSLTASYAGFVNGDTPASLTIPPTLATSATTTSSVGSYAITASGAVDPDYTIGYVSGTLTITAATTTTTITSSANPSTAGQSVTFTATVTAGDPGAGTPTGQVQFVIDGSNYGDPVTLNDGTALITDAALTVAGSPHSVSAVYTDPDGNYAGPPGDLIGGQVVNPATTVYVDASYAGDTPGTPVTWIDGSTHSFGVDAFDTIQGGVNAVAVGGTVDVAPGTYNEVVTIGNDLTLAGAGPIPGATVLDGPGPAAGSAGITIVAGDVSVSGLTIEDFSGAAGIDVAGGGVATLAGDTIAYNGTGVRIEAGGTATVNDCTLSDNTSADSGGGVNNEGTVTLSNCTISGNSAGYGGGIAVGQGGDATIYGGSITGNSVQYDGGGIEDVGTLALTNCTVSGNSAANAGGIGYGGGIQILGTATIYDATITSNSASNGGGIAVGQDGYAMVNGGSITSNSAQYDGGGIENSGTLALTNCTISGNSAADAGDIGYGGGIQNLGTATIYGATITSNSASYGGGIGIGQGGYASVNGGSITGNSAQYDGGGIEDLGTLALTNCTISGNSASDGGGIENDGSLSVTGGAISRNSAQYNGGGIDSYTTATVTGSTIADNTAAAGGSLDNEASTTSLIGCTISGNGVDGTVQVQAGTVSLQGTTSIMGTGGLSVAGGATLAFDSGTATLGDGTTVTGAGTVAVRGGTVSISGGADVQVLAPVAFSAGTITGAGHLIVAHPCPGPAGPSRCR